MSIDLRVGFKEGHRKRLYESIEVVTPSPKRSCPKKVREEPMRNDSTTPMPPSDVARSSSVAAAAKEACLAPAGAPGDPTSVEEDLDQKDVPASVPPLSWEEMLEMLNRVPCFTDVKLPSTKMSNFFPLTK